MPIKEDWLSQVEEEILEPDIPVIDPHHHLWDRPDGRYMVEDLQADVATGHNIVSTVFVECASMYRPTMRLKEFHKTPYEQETLSTGKLLSNMQRSGPKQSMV